MDEYRKMFGADGYYLADVFNERPPQVEPTTKEEGLEGKRPKASTMRSARATPRDLGDARLAFLQRGQFLGGEGESRPYLSGVPKDKILLLDLFAENTEVCVGLPRSESGLTCGACSTTSVAAPRGLVTSMAWY